MCVKIFTKLFVFFVYSYHMVSYDRLAVQFFTSVAWQVWAIPNILEITCGWLPPNFWDPKTRDPNIWGFFLLGQLHLFNHGQLWRERLQHPLRWWRFDQSPFPSSCSQHLLAWCWAQAYEAKVEDSQAVELGRAFEKAVSLECIQQDLSNVLLHCLLQICPRLAERWLAEYDRHKK